MARTRTRTSDNDADTPDVIAAIIQAAFIRINEGDLREPSRW